MTLYVKSFVRLLAALLLVLAARPAAAFHSGGVAECEGCHSMHNPAADGYALLVGSDASSACLTCHEHAGDTGPNGYHVSSADSDMEGDRTPLQRSPGGDFGWLKKSYSWVEDGATVTETGDSHGHNVVAVDNGYGADGVNTMAPGGTFVASQLGCHSCHDPHGQARRTSAGFVGAPVSGMSQLNGIPNALPIVASGSYNNSPAPAAGEAVGVYRILAGVGYTRAAGVTWGGFPVAVAPATYNRSEDVTHTRVAYGGTRTNSWADWCGSCHDGMHAGGDYVHPVEEVLNGLAPIYNAYIASGNLSGNGTAAYTSLVPFAENTASFSVLASHALNTGSGVAAMGPSSADRVTCISCHRAHASGFPYLLRWQPGYEFITKGGQYIAPAPENPLVTGSRALIQSRGRTLVAQQQAAYYDRPASKFATYQRLLCNKCHGKD